MDGFEEEKNFPVNRNRLTAGDLIFGFRTHVSGRANDDDGCAIHLAIQDGTEYDGHANRCDCHATC
jgi:hypothetical protein